MPASSAAAPEIESRLRELGYSEFRPGQGQAIKVLLDAGRLLLVAPTGGGKSLVYQLPAILLGGTSLVVSPLIALMNDQVAALRARGVSATFLASTLDAAEMRARLGAIGRGDLRIVYVAPERLVFPGFRDLVSRLRPPLVAVSARKLPTLRDDLDLASFREAVERTIAALERAGDAAAADTARRVLAIVEATPDPKARRAAIGRAFRVVRVRDPLLLTAYFEPELDGRLTPDERFRQPLFGRRADLVDVYPPVLDPACRCRRTAARLEGDKLRPYYSRGEIGAGALDGRGLEIAWADDPFELFVLHVQGSGRLRLADGSVVGVGFAGSNGRPYSSLGRTLVKQGLLPVGQASLGDIRRYFESVPPEERDDLLATNERYTFFRLTEGGPVGSLGVELTPGRSIATDPRLVPPGTIGYLSTPTVRRFVVSQDTGGAVTGAHADLFLGYGDEAGERAGRTRDRGALYLLFPAAP